MTQFPPSTHLSFIHKRMPTWLTRATPSQRQALKRKILASHAATRRVAKALKPVQDVDTFCRPLFEQALRRWFPDAHLPNIDQGRIWHERRVQSWFEAALQNFDRNATPRLYDSVLAPKPSELDVHTFVSGVRNLDLGQRYRDHLDDHLDTDAFRQLLRQKDHAAFDATLSLARLGGHVDERGAAVALTVLSGLNDSARAQLHCSFLTLFDTALNGPLLIHLDPARKSADCLLYLPGHKQRPLRQYASQQAAATALTQMLWQAQERTFFLRRYVGLAEQPAFANRLRATLYPRYPYAHLQSTPVLQRGERFSWIKRLFPAPSDLWQETLDQNARLSFTLTAWRQDAFVERARTEVELRLLDAAKLAVPVAQRDAAAQLARIEAWLGVGLSVLNVAGFFVPGLGEALLVIGGAQLVDTFLEGVHAANEGDAQAAISHLFEVFENLAMFAAMGAATRFHEPPGILHGWHKVGAKGEERLWHGELAPFARPRPWPQGRLAGQDGLQQWQGRPWLERDDLALPLERPQEGGLRLAPAKGHRHQPRLHGNGQGTWLLEHDNPLTWDQAALLKRLGPTSNDLDPASLAQALRCSGYDAAALRKALLDHEPLPALLVDMFETFGASPMTVDEPSLASILARDFPGLSPRARAEIFANARARDIIQLQRTGRLPLPMAETARLYLREKRINKALARFKHSGGNADDRDLLAFSSLRRLPGWTGRVAVELRAGSLAGGRVTATETAPVNTKVIVRSGGRYRAYDEHGLELSAGDDLYDALLHALPDSERNALGMSIQQPAELRDKLFEMAAGDRRQSALDLGLAPIRPMYRLPSRLPGERRIGYRLSGRGQGPLSDDALFDQLYPANAAGDRDMLRVRLRYQAGAMPGRFRRLLERLQEEYRQLDTSLQRWVDDVEGTALDAPQQQRASRRALARRIRAAWRRESHDTDGTIDHVSLVLEAQQAGSLPTLAVVLPHVRHLTINGLVDPQAVQLDRFLRAFPGTRGLDLAQNALNRLPNALGELSELQTLDLAENHFDLGNDENLAIFDRLPHLQRLSLTDAIEGLPVAALERLAQRPALNWLMADLNDLTLGAEHFQALQRWPALRTLSLGQNEITLDEAARTALAGLDRLEMLNLDDNPLGLAPNVSGWNHLLTLDLQDARISHWPEGLQTLMNQATLREVDLSANMLTDAPDLHDTLFARSVRGNLPGFDYSFDDNPFTDEARQTLERAGFRIIMSPEGSLDWPDELQGLMTTAQDSQWDSLHELMERLPHTADYQRSPAAMQRRMTHVLRTLLEGDSAGAEAFGRAMLRQQVIDLLEDAARECVDQASLLFQQIETDVQVWQGAARAAPGTSDQAVAVDTATALYRQCLLDARIGEVYQARRARRRALDADDETQREAAPPLHSDDDISDIALHEPDYLLDELEMALYARIHLRAQLGLPTQPSEMRFSQLARLSNATLQRVSAAVEASATADNLARWVADQAFWSAWLRRLLPEAFEGLAREWEAASEYFDALSASMDSEGDYVGPAVPAGFIDTLEQDVHDIPGLSWRRQGIVQRQDLSAPRFSQLQPSALERVGGALLQARKNAEMELVTKLTARVIAERAAAPST